MKVKRRDVFVLFSLSLSLSPPPSLSEPDRNIVGSIDELIQDNPNVTCQKGSPKLRVKFKDPDPLSGTAIGQWDKTSVGQNTSGTKHSWTLSCI